MTITKQDINEIKGAVGEKIDEKIGNSFKGFEDKIAEKIDSKIDDLAGMIKRGFDETATKAELNSFKTVVAEKFDHMHARLSAIESGVEEIQKHFIYRYEFEDLMARVKYLETKLGVESGK